MYLSIVIPAYNEEKRIFPTLEGIRDFFEGRDLDYEVIVVDDGSDDRTAEKALSSALYSEGRLRVVRNGSNRGKGFAVRNGILNSNGEYVLLDDADSSTPVSEIDKLIECVGEGYDIAIGSRSIKGSDIRVRQPWYREKMGKTFNLFVKLLLLRQFNDTQCGFKLFKGDAARELARDMKIDGFCFDVEMLYLASRKGYSVKEIGVIWDNSPQSRVRVIGSSASMFLDLFKIRKIHG